MATNSRPFGTSLSTSSERCPWRIRTTPTSPSSSSASDRFVCCSTMQCERSAEVACGSLRVSFPACRLAGAMGSTSCWVKCSPTTCRISSSARPSVRRRDCRCIRLLSRTAGNWEAAASLRHRQQQQQLQLPPHSHALQCSQNNKSTIYNIQYTIDNTQYALQCVSMKRNGGPRLFHCERLFYATHSHLPDFRCFRFSSQSNAAKSKHQVAFANTHSTPIPLSAGIFIPTAQNKYKSKNGCSDLYRCIH